MRRFPAARMTIRQVLKALELPGRLSSTRPLLSCPFSNCTYSDEIVRQERRIDGSRSCSRDRYDPANRFQRYDTFFLRYGPWNGIPWYENNIVLSRMSYPRCQLEKSRSKKWVAIDQKKKKKKEISILRIGNDINEVAIKNSLGYYIRISRLVIHFFNKSITSHRHKIEHANNRVMNRRYTRKQTPEFRLRIVEISFGTISPQFHSLFIIPPPPFKTLPQITPVIATRARGRDTLEKSPIILRRIHLLATTLLQLRKDRDFFRINFIPSRPRHIFIERGISAAPLDTRE